MPNIEEAAAMLPDSVSDAVVDPASEPTGESGLPAHLQAAPEMAPAKAASSQDEVLARIEAIKNRRQAQKDRARNEHNHGVLMAREASVKSILEELEGRKRSLDETEGKWKAALKDPLKFKELGQDPLELYKRITEAAANADTPEGHAERLRDEFRSIVSEKDKALAEIREELKAFKAAAEQEKQQHAQDRELAKAQARTEKFFSILKLDKYQDLTDAYDDSELVAMANAWHGESTTPLDPQQAADAVCNWYSAKSERRAARQKEREAAKSRATGQPVGDSAASPSDTRPSTIGNGLASSTASSATRKRSRAELLKEAEAELGVFMATKR